MRVNRAADQTVLALLRADAPQSRSSYKMRSREPCKRYPVEGAVVCHLTLAKWEEDLEGLIFENEDIVDAEVVEDEPRVIPPSDVLTEEDSEPSWVGGPRHRTR